MSRSLCPSPTGRKPRMASREFTDFDAIAAELNGRPRQTLGFKTTPSEALAEALR
jgi:IS30 family transposase